MQNNCRNGPITIPCPFGWDTLEVLGRNPSEQRFDPAYKARLRAIATEFRDEPDVWLEVWNEPYWWDGRSNKMRAERASENARLQQASLGRQDHHDGVCRGSQEARPRHHQGAGTRSLPPSGGRAWSGL